MLHTAVPEENPHISADEVSSSILRISVLIMSQHDAYCHVLILQYAKIDIML